MSMTLIIIPMVHMVNMMIVMKVYDYVVCHTHKHDSDTSSSDKSFTIPDRIKRVMVTIMLT